MVLPPPFIDATIVAQLFKLNGALTKLLFLSLQNQNRCNGTSVMAILTLCVLAGVRGGGGGGGGVYLQVLDLRPVQ